MADAPDSHQDRATEGQDRASRRRQAIILGRDAGVTLQVIDKGRPPRTRRNFRVARNDLHPDLGSRNGTSS